MVMSASPAPSSSASVSEGIIQKKSKKPKNKGKKVAADIIVSGKNEGVDPHWAYKPPPGVVLVEEEVNVGDFDWDVINNDDDLDLWLIRAPQSVQPRYLDNISVDPLSSSNSTPVGVIKRKHATFDIWSIGDDDNQLGEEIKAISCLLPRKGKKGKLYSAPKQIARRLVIAAQAVKPTSDDPPLDNAAVIEKFKNPPRQSYPAEVLKHKFMPYGSVVDVQKTVVEEVMDVDSEIPLEHFKQGKFKSFTEVETKPKGKRRRVENEGEDKPTIKKSKKTKAT